MNTIRRAGPLVLIACLGLAFAGCDNKLLDPTQIGRFRPTPAVNVILDSLGVAEETPVAWENAEAPRRDDILAVPGDYRLRGGDLVRISVFELFQEGATMINDYVVSESGKLSIPEVGVVQAAGLTETQLEEEIKQILSPAILKQPSVTVTLMNSQQRTYSILGNGVPQPGRYSIPRYDFRLSDALATAGGPMQFNVSHIYIARSREVTDGGIETGPTGSGWDELELIEPGTSGAKGQGAPARPAPAGPVTTSRPREIPEPSEPAEKFELEREMLDLIAPSAKSNWPASEKVVTRSPVAAGSPTVSASVMPGGFRLLVPDRALRAPAPRADEIVVTPSEFGASGQFEQAESTLPAGRIEWIFQNGKWVPISVQAGEETATRAARKPEEKPTAAAPVEQQATGQIEWVLRDGQWRPEVKGTASPAAPAAEPRRAPTAVVEKPPLPMAAEGDGADQTRLIRVPADQLLAGDARYNIVIKPGDTVYVPVDIIGEFCITGNVNRSGFIGITGRPMTLKMAIAAAGGLGPLAYPRHCEVIRRIGENREEIVMVDLDKIASGEQPDFFIKPNDLINVGTHPTSRWRAVLRNAFRAAYGFGFVYDRNFAYSDTSYGTSFF